MNNEQPIAIASPSLPRLSDNSQEQYTSQPCLTQSPVYSNVHGTMQQPLSKSQSFAHNLDTTNDKRLNMMEDLHLDPVEIRENHILGGSITDKHKDTKLDNDLTLQDKENILLSASRLRLLQDTTMIESALDLDSLDDSSIGTNSQAGLMKIVV